MKIFRLNVLLIVVVFFAFTQLVCADDFNNNSMQEWNLKRLLHPSKQQLAMEHKHKVFLYMGMKDVDVDRAMDMYFNRIESMMIAGIIRTDKSGRVMRDPNTGEVLTEDDSC